MGIFILVYNLICAIPLLISGGIMYGVWLLFKWTLPILGLSIILALMCAIFTPLCEASTRKDKREKQNPNPAKKYSKKQINKWVDDMVNTELMKVKQARPDLSAEQLEKIRQQAREYAVNEFRKQGYKI